MTAAGQENVQSFSLEHADTDRLSFLNLTDSIWPLPSLSPPSLLRQIAFQRHKLSAVTSRSDLTYSTAAMAVASQTDSKVFWPIYAAAVGGNDTSQLKNLPHSFLPKWLRLRTSGEPHMYERTGGDHRSEFWPRGRVYR